MLFQVIEENGQKKIKPLTADTGTGAPVGSLIAMYKKSSPSGYLYCDGSTFDQTKYPALYQYLGSNVLPDYRECVAVGAEQNTTDTIATHDVYTEGQFKDDQLQNHEHGLTLIGIDDSGSVPRGVGAYLTSNGYTSPAQSVSGGAYGSIRLGTTTHGKQKAVFIYIKATSGLTENQQENVLNTINENLSYSTTEHFTGRCTADGKKIYSKTLICAVDTAGYTNHGISNLLDFTKIEAISKASNGQYRPIPFAYSGDLQWACGITIDDTKVTIEAGSNFKSFHTSATVTLEYTKTTDN